MTYWPAAAEAAAEDAEAAECAAEAAECAEAEEVCAAVAAAPFTAAEGVPQWGVHPPCRDPQHRDPPWVGHPAEATSAAEGQARDQAGVVDRIMETCRLLVAGPDREPAFVPAEVSPVADRGLVGHDPAAQGPVALDQAAVVWQVAARDLAVVHRQVTWETFLICQGLEAPVLTVPVPVRQSLPEAPQQSQVEPRQISCKTGRQLNRALARALVLVVAILQPTFLVLAQGVKD